MSLTFPAKEVAAASTLLALATEVTVTRPALRTNTLNQAPAPFIMAGEVNAGILLSLERKVQKTSHQEQISKQNERKRKAVHAQAHMYTATLIAK
jgi:hypothetical protein